MQGYTIADLPVCYDASFPTLRERSRKYADPSLRSAARLVVTQADIAAIRETTPLLDDDLREYMLMGKAFYEYLILHDGMMLHASAVVVDDVAYLFSAPSGTGKSTHTALWLRHFGSDAYILNDDKPALRVSDDTVYAYGTPFSGKHDISANLRVPLRAIAFIVRSPDNRIERISESQALYEILNQTARPGSTELYQKLLQNVAVVLEKTPVYKLYCNMEDEAVTVAYETMRKGITE